MKQSIKYEQIIDRITDAFFVVGTDGVLSYASESVSKLVGYSPEELIGKSSLDFIHPEEHDLAVENQSMLLSYPGNRITHDYRILNSHNTYQWVECIFVNMTNIPQVGGIMVQMRDVSERKTVELMLEESREQFRMFMSQIPAAAWIRDDEGRYVFMNETFERFMNVKAGEIMGKTFREVFPEYAENIYDTDRLCKDLCKEIEFMERGPDSTGAIKDWVVYKFPIPRSSGKTFIGALGFDVSRMIEAKDLIRAAEDKFKLVFDHAPDAIFIEDEEGCVIDANFKACELQGLSLNELKGKNILELTPEQNRELVASQYRKMWEGDVLSLKSFTWSAQDKEIPVEIHVGKIRHMGKPALILTLRELNVN